MPPATRYHSGRIDQRASALLISLALVVALLVLGAQPMRRAGHAIEAVKTVMFDVAPPPAPPPIQPETPPQRPPETRPAAAPEGAAGGTARQPRRIAAPMAEVAQPAMPDRSIAPAAPPLPVSTLPAGSPPGSPTGRGVAGNGSGTASGAGSGTGNSGNGSGSGEAIVRADWVRGPPRPSQLAQFYPGRARRAGVSGWGLLRCYVRANNHVRGCESVGETPEGSGFGDAARRAAYLYRVRPPMRDGKVAEDIPVYIAVGFGNP
ncbi:energy transducer TonB [Stakelama tenebrarum]|uniref:Uncharacterized protein n=1 Tax=Stakelama tenebrarum TaxID=2711215 RepID=A0A6G6Y0N1_9SPHN|nr:energy transducer TonB [Sphingosinithalassobacter tenebrarum]QIG78470.1 hypothetical protein G5C33_00775 [Sphingosinithalassobacter tenebrarum]